MKKLEIKLNKEYENIGEISISEIHEDIIDISKIEYIREIIDVIEPLNNDEPIVVSKRYSDSYTLIDGYHRLKNKILNGEKSVKVIVLDIYKINRKIDSLFDFFSNLTGKTIKFISDEIFLVDNKYYKIKCNEGCGGCSNGWSNIDISNEYKNKDIKIKKVEQKGKEDGDEYDLYINDNLVAKVDTGYGNGYYGGDFEICYTN